VSVCVCLFGFVGVWGCRCMGVWVCGCVGVWVFVCLCEGVRMYVYISGERDMHVQIFNLLR
jgi:hypothetical protein